MVQAACRVIQESTSARQTYRAVAASTVPLGSIMRTPDRQIVSIATRARLQTKRCKQAAWNAVKTILQRRLV
jgi:hypothetical protein